MILKERGGNNDVHALLSPSGAKKWLACSASLACEKDIPNTSGKAAVLGTAMHTLAETHLNQYIKGTELPLERDVGAYVLEEGKGAVKALIKPMKGAVLITADMIEEFATRFRLSTMLSMKARATPRAMILMNCWRSSPVRR
ncbi:hypothetical protein QA038_gp40 [Salmonella phage JD01]|uniref:Uncharacterized protein n=1 Tax=Salmonella phage JD01 TaxID=2831178 RepID=A0A8E6P010_9CAUD|nr:hypothetical protein QA038_gp40 [Salmonella phage JD01]QVQ56320.1 hypothetical protein [Salmonella phage JD01]